MTLLGLVSRTFKRISSNLPRKDVIERFKYLAGRNVYYPEYSIERLAESSGINPPDEIVHQIHRHHLNGNDLDGVEARIKKYGLPSEQDVQAKLVEYMENEDFGRLERLMRMTKMRLPEETLKNRFEEYLARIRDLNEELAYSVEDRIEAVRPCFCGMDMSRPCVSRGRALFYQQKEEIEYQYSLLEERFAKLGQTLHRFIEATNFNPNEQIQAEFGYLLQSDDIAEKAHQNKYRRLVTLPGFKPSRKTVRDALVYHFGRYPTMQFDDVKKITGRSPILPLGVYLRMAYRHIESGLMMAELRALEIYTHLEDFYDKLSLKFSRPLR